MMHRILALAAFIALSCTTVSVAQDVVVSEYKNEPDPVTYNEWTEIVVVKDNMSIVGYIVHDNNAAQDTRQGGVRFKDLPIFRNVREGTIIVINHRDMPTGVPTDADPSDGYMEFAARNQTYFDAVLFGGSTWELSALNIAQDGDYIEVLRPDSVHVHGLGHRFITGSFYDASARPKVNHKVSTLNNNNSASVIGRSLAAYDAGVGTDSTSMNLDAGGASSRVTKGLPNKIEPAKEAGGMLNRNHLLWREWREPEWSGTPAVTIVSQTPTKHVISWTPLVDPYPQDSLTGVMILRDTTDFVGFSNSNILDGTIYSVGQRIGVNGPIVVAVQPNAAGNQYADSSNISCGGQYTYRVVPYRYKHDVRLGTITAEMARGRQYTEGQVATSARITKSQPSKPVITASTLQICPGDTVVLFTTAVAETYEWTFNGQPMPPTPTPTRIVVGEAGSYKLTIKANGGCTAESDVVTISYLPASVINVTPSTPQKICAGGSVVITADRDAPAFQWLRDGVTIAGASGKSYTVTQAGNYQVRTASATGCPAVSPLVRVSLYDVRVSAAPTSLDFGSLDECETSKTLTFDLTNNGTETVIMSSASFPDGYTLSDPPPGFTLVPGQRQIVRIRFTPTKAGASSGNAVFTIQPCDQKVSVRVNGIKTKSSIAVDRAGVDFGTFVACGAVSTVRVDSTFTITNSGSVDVTVKAPALTPPFYLLTQDFPVVLTPNSSKSITVQYRPLGAFSNAAVIQEIAFPFSSSTCTDTLRSGLVAATFQPTVALASGTLQLPQLLSCKNTFDTTITVQNTGNVNVVVRSADANVVFTGGPVAVDAGTSQVIPVTITTPTAPGPFTINATLIADTCAISIPLIIRGDISDTRPSLSATTGTLGRVFRCETVPTRSSSFSIDVGAAKSGRATIRSISISDPMFTVDVTPGTVVQGTLPFTVTYAPTADGAHSATITFTMDPCGDVLTLDVSGSAAMPAHFISPIIVNMGTIALGQTSTRTAKVVNTGSDPIRVEPPQGVLPPFRVTSTQPVLPATIAPGDSVVYTIEYSYAGAQRTDVGELRSIISAPCAQADTISISGTTSAPSVITGVTISVPMDLTAVSGSLVEVPFRLSTVTDIASADVRSMNVYVQYDPSLMRPLSITGGPTTTVSGVVQESVLGKARFTLTSTTPIVAADPLFIVRAQTYVGDATSTPIVVDSAIASGILVVGEPGLLVLTGSCAFSSLQAGIGARSSVRVLSMHSDLAVVEVTTITNDPVSITLRNTNGSIVVAPRTGVYAPGVHTIDLPLETLATGLYYVTMDHGLRHATVPVMITR